MRILLILALCIGSLNAVDMKVPEPDAVNLELAVTANEHMKVPVLIAVVAKPKQKQQFTHIAGLLKKAFEFTGEVDATIRDLPLPKKNKDLQSLDEEGFMRVCYLTYNEKQHTLSWRLYDPADALMLVGKSCKLEKDNDRQVALAIADELWPEFTGQDGFFSTKIAYCVKQDSQKRNNHEYQHIKHIYVCDYDGGNAKAVVESPTLNIAPRWSSSLERPRLYYSRCTASNMQLIEMDTSGKRRIVLNADGLNMLPSFSPSGKGVAYNHGGQIMVKSVDPQTKKSVYTAVTNNAANNVSPNLLDNGDVIFCSDHKSKNPQIYRYYADNKEVERLTSDGYCSCPAYNAKADTVVYAKLVKGVSQLFMYDCATKSHEQVTFDPGHKDEPSFSPCGALLVFSVERSGQCRIAIMHLVTKERRYITSESLHATYGSWSPRYPKLPSF